MSNLPSSPNFHEAEIPAVMLGGRTKQLKPAPAEPLLCAPPRLGMLGFTCREGPRLCSQGGPTQRLRVEQNSAEHEEQGGKPWRALWEHLAEGPANLGPGGSH